MPVIVVYELFKKILRERGERFALEVYVLLSQGQVVDVDSVLAISAARFNLLLVDSLIYATAQRFSATLWTQDEHFAQLPGVRFFPKYLSSMTDEPHLYCRARPIFG